MTQEILFGADHLRFYQGSKEIYPLIHGDRGGDEDVDAWTIVLPSHLDSDLDWKLPTSQAEEALKAGKWIVWHFDFGIENPSFDLIDETHFLSFTVAIDLFVKTLYPRFKEATFGVSLYRGDLSVVPLATEVEDSHFLEWCEEGNHDPKLPFSRDLFSFEIFAQYLHRLVSFFPDTVIPLVCFDITEWHSTGLLSVLLSKKRFEHVHLALRGGKSFLGRLQWEHSGVIHCLKQVEPVTAVCIPEDLFCSEEVCKRLDALFEKLEERALPFRLISEESLTEEWDGIDQLYVLPKSLSVQGKRKLLGFEAAGGEVVWVES